MIVTACQSNYIAAMIEQTPRNAEAELKLLAESRAHDDAPRVERVKTEYGVFWIKRPEKLNLRFRLIKGDPRKAFERERLGLHDVNAAGGPAPQLAAEGPDFFVLPDCGPDLRHRLRQVHDAEVRRSLLMDCARSLGELHAMGLSHGRPSPKDMCRVNGKELLLDFERYDRANNNVRGHAEDLVIWAFNVSAHSPEVRDNLPEALEVYSDIAPAGVRAVAEEKCRKLVWANWLTKPLQMRPGNKSKEAKAIPSVLELFGARV